MDREIQPHIAMSKSFFLKDQRLKFELEFAQKALAKSETKLNKFVKGKEALDSLTTITSNREKRRLDFQGESSHASKQNYSKTSVIRFISVSDQKSHFKQSLLYSQKISQAKDPNNSFKTISPKSQKPKRPEPILLKPNSRKSYQRRSPNFVQQREE